jgi:type IV fimbrial biogenesis protein FimT
MCSSSSVRPVSGFTIFELVMVMAIAAILVGIGIPSFQYVTASNRISSEINGLLADMRLARVEAIKEGLPVTVCASADGQTCIGSTNGGAWTSGWIIFSDPSSNQTPPNAQSVLRVQPALSVAYKSSTDTLTDTTNSTYAVTFNRQGFGSSFPITTNTVTVALRSTPENTNWTRCLAITPVGLLTIQRNLTGNCT